MAPISRRAGWIAAAASLMVVSGILAALQQQQQQPDPPSIVTRDGYTLTVIDAVCDTEMYELFAQHARGVATLREPLNMVSKEDLQMTVVHDCQRLVTEHELGPLVSVLASTRRIEARNFQTGIVVAEIINYSNQSYGHLGIEPGVSCLWIKGDVNADPTGASWEAAIRRPDSGHCLQPFTGNPKSSEILQLKRLTYNDTIYPSSARWMFDRQNARQFIGIRCGYGWCELGKAGFQSTTRLTDWASVPGWFDEQYLSYLPPHSIGGLRLSGIWGRIAPVTPLDLSPLGATERTVASVELDGDDAQAWMAYKEKLPIRMTSKTHGAVRLRIQGVMAGGGGGSGGASAAPATGPVLFRQVAGVNSNTWSVPKFNRHNQHAGMGAVRWAWNELDEGTWFWCDGGCCRNDDYCPTGGCN